jgi:hypothetical protein
MEPVSGSIRRVLQPRCVDVVPGKPQLGRQNVITASVRSVTPHHLSAPPHFQEPFLMFCSWLKPTFLKKKKQPMSRLASYSRSRSNSFVVNYFLSFASASYLTQGASTQPDTQPANQPVNQPANQPTNQQLTNKQTNEQTD